MYLRCNKRFKDGKQHRYWNIVENKRVVGRGIVQRQVLYLGEINDNQQEACLRATHRQIKELKKLLPDIGEHLAIDSKPLIESFRGGKKDTKESSDSEADWGVKTYRGEREDGSP